MLPIVCINYSGSVKGTSSIKKTPIESRFPLYQYLSLGFIQELNLHDFPWIRVVFKYYFGRGYLLCWYFFLILMTGSHLETKQDYKNMWSQDQHSFPPSPTNRTSAGYVKKHSMANLTIFKWGSNLLGVWSHLNHKDNLASVQTVATCSISRGCTFAWRRQSCPSRRDGNWRRHATPYGYLPLLWSTNIDDDVTHSVLVPYVHKTRTLQKFSCWFSST